jgi:tRNA modification GTPase
MHDVSQTIVAPAAAAAGGARAIVRISGPRTVAILQEIASISVPADRRPAVISAVIRLTLGRTNLAEVLPVEIWLWPTARSYTRQPLAEIHLPGSPPLVELVIERLLAAGARLAQPGEFTLRAYLAGRLDLLQAEAVLGLIDARDESGFQAALAQLAGGFSTPLETLRGELLDLLADLEAGLDFVDEDLDFVSNAEVQRRLGAAEMQVAELLQRLASRDANQSLPRVVLLGSPNAGKSQLFNALVGETAAIVSSIAGTTRDYLRGPCDCDGLAVELIDTAGIEMLDHVEISPAGLAQQKTDGQRAQADLQLWCVDLSAKQLQYSDHVAGISSIPRIDVGTKSDLATACHTTTNHLRTSALSGEGLTQLRREIASKLRQQPGEIMASSAARCRGSLAATLAALREARRRAQLAEHDEWLAADLRAALAELGQVTGAVQTNDLLDRIFSRFCIGK